MKTAFVGFSFILALIATACGPREETPSDGSESVDTLHLSVADTIGVLMGDSTLMFGTISNACYHPDGSILVLDGMKAGISVFSPQGDLLAVHGRKGSGPGEYQYPRFMTVLADGSIAVSDWGVNTLVVLNPDFSYRETIEGFYPVAPGFLCAAADSGYVAGAMRLQPSDSEAGYEGCTFLGWWNESNEPSFEYLEYPLDISVESDGENTSVNVQNVDAVFDTDPAGNVYVAIRSDSTYRIDRYTRNGVLDLTITQDWQRIAKTEEELQREIIVESHSRSGDGSTSSRMRSEEDVYPWHNAISVIKTDDQGNLWVGQGYTSMPVFHVYDSSGKLTMVVSIPELEGVTGLDYSFRNGLLAYDYAPEEYPKVYLLEPAD